MATSVHVCHVGIFLRRRKCFVVFFSLIFDPDVTRGWENYASIILGILVGAPEHQALICRLWYVACIHACMHWSMLQTDKLQSLFRMNQYDHMLMHHTTFLYSEHVFSIHSINNKKSVFRIIIESLTIQQPLILHYFSQDSGNNSIACRL